MREVRVQKQDLRARVQANRNGHRVEYEAAQEAFKNAVKAWFELQAERIASGEQFATQFLHPRPQDHTEDYDRVLDMIEMSQDDFITLRQDEFAQYVRDEWGWQAMSKSTAAFYTSNAPADIASAAPLSG